MCLSVLAFVCVIAFVTPAESAQPFQLTTSSAADEWPSWAPDGQTIVFQSNRTGASRIFKMPAEGGVAVQLSFGPGEDIYPEVSADGTWVAFTRSSGGGGLIYKVPTAGGSTIQVSYPNHPGDLDWTPAWSPDGSTIYFSRGPGDDPGWFLMSAPSTGGTATQAFFGAGLAGNPTVSPDGTHIAMSNYVGGFAPYNVIEALVSDTSQWDQLTFAPSGNTGPWEYRADGNRLLYSSPDGLPSGLGGYYELDLLTLQSTPIVIDQLGRGISYSPDGTRVVYSNLSPAGDLDLWILALDDGPAFQDQITVGSDHGLPGASVRIPIDLENTFAVRGVELRIDDIPDDLTITGVELSHRANTMTVSFVDNGDLHLLLYGDSGQSIPVGSGPILELLGSISPTTVLGDSIDLQVTEALVSDTAGGTLSITANDGRVDVKRRLGDITGDNLVDVGDLVRLVEIILGTGAAPTPDELVAADCNLDLAVNIGDITCLTDLILTVPQAPLPTLPALMQIAIDVETPVKGLQIHLPAETSLALGTGTQSMRLSTGLVAGAPCAVLYDPSGVGWDTGSEVTLMTSTLPVRASDIRAFGPGGRPLNVSLQESRVLIGDSISRLRALPNRPNPFREATTLRFESATEGRARLEVFDLRGARVANPIDIPVRRGLNQANWEALDSKGRPLAAGVYLARWTLEKTGETASLRLIHLR